MSIRFLATAVLVALLGFAPVAHAGAPIRDLLVSVTPGSEQTVLDAIVAMADVRRAWHVDLVHGVAGSVLAAEFRLDDEAAELALRSAILSVSGVTGVRLPYLLVDRND